MEITNIRERLGQAREKCPFLDEETYVFTESLAEELNDTLTPIGLVLAIALAASAIESGQLKLLKEKYPVQNAYERRKLLDRAKFILQIIDEVTDEDFANEVRSGCEEALGWVVVKRAKLIDRDELRETFSPSTIAAVEWWTTAIQHKGSSEWFRDAPTVYMELTTEEITAFRRYLAEDIEKSMPHGTVCLHVDYVPYWTLAEAAAAANIDQSDAYFLFPSKTMMTIRKDSIELISGGDSEIIWRAEPTATE